MSHMNSSQGYKLSVYDLFLHDYFCVPVYSIEGEEKIVIKFL